MEREKTGEPLMEGVFRCAFAAALCLSLLLFPAEGRAARIICISSVGGAAGAPCSGLWISGEIEAGDNVRFQKLLARYPEDVTEVYLSSKGGDVREAMEIGKVIRKNDLKVYAPTMDSCGLGVLSVQPSGEKLCEGYDCSCASACFLLWVAGTGTREGNKLGIHRPFPSFASEGIGRAVAVYKKMTLRPHLLNVLSEVRGYLATMQIQVKFIDLMTRSASDDVYWLDADEAAAMSVPYGLSLLENIDF